VPNLIAGWLSFVLGALFVGFADRQHYSLPILFAGAISALAIGLFHAAIGAIAARIGSECRSRLFPPEILEPIRRQCRIDHLTRRYGRFSFFAARIPAAAVSFSHM
jgi:hypothetical protein